MTPGSKPGLTAVPTEELRILLRYLHRTEISCPLTPQELARVGLQHRSEYLLACLRGLDQAGTRAVLIAVLAERDR